MAWWDIWLNKAKKAVSKVTETVSNIYTSIKKTVSTAISKVTEKVEAVKDYVVEEVREKTKKVKEKIEGVERTERRTGVISKIELTDAQINIIKEAEKAGFIDPAEANAYFERDMRGEIIEKDIVEIKQMEHDLIGLKDNKAIMENRIIKQI
ncbi:unnamed protein product [marine sediment metagenome]|uniref:Uncharacterized protein n=1 Tax=marine sediment metagenome TaxID=412755 RepID=X1K7I1_9ZZZZ